MYKSTVPYIPPGRKMPFGIPLSGLSILSFSFFIGQFGQVNVRRETLFHSIFIDFIYCLLAGHVSLTEFLV
jgi:hypothetical protein